jgi:flagellum-specific ATP synthase
MEEPIADILRGVLDGHIVLDRDIAERGRYPAINVLRSVSRSLPAAATAEENEMIMQARRHLAVYEQNALMIRAGLYSTGSDQAVDLAVQVWPELDAYLARKETQSIENSFTQLELAFRRSNVPVQGIKHAQPPRPTSAA